LYLSSDLETPSSPIAGALPAIRTKLTDNFSQVHFLPTDDSPHPGVIRFKRYVQARWDTAGKKFVPLDQPKWRWETTVLVIMTAEDVIDKIAVCNDELGTWAGDFRLMLGMGAKDQMFVMIKGLQKYYSKTKSLANKEYTAQARAVLGEKEGEGGRGRANSARPSKEIIERELVKLQVAHGCFLIHGEQLHVCG
jgi:crossover junction endonuclease EME1